MSTVQHPTTLQQCRVVLFRKDGHATLASTDGAMLQNVTGPWVLERERDQAQEKGQQ